MKICGIVPDVREFEEDGPWLISAPNPEKKNPNHAKPLLSNSQTAAFLLILSKFWNLIFRFPASLGPFVVESICWFSMVPSLNFKSSSQNDLPEPPGSHFGPVRPSGFRAPGSMFLPSGASFGDFRGPFSTALKVCLQRPASPNKKNIF